MLIFAHELGHFLVAKKMGLLVEEFGFGFPPRMFSWKRGETTYSVNWLPFGGFVRIYGEDAADVKTDVPPGRSFAAQRAWKRALIVVAGVVMNFMFGWFLLSLIFMIGTPKALFISQVLPDSPALSAGLKAQDQIQGFSTAKDFIDYINRNRGKEIVLAVRRGPETLEFKAVPRLKEEAALGVALVESGTERQAFVPAVWNSLKASVGAVVGIVAGFITLFGGLFTGGHVAADVVGPVGVFGVASQAGQLGILYVVQLVALISLNLTVLNIFPFPALDGGRLLFIILEKIKGSPLNPKFERAANAAGFALLLALMIAVTVRDVVRLF